MSDAESAKCNPSNPANIDDQKGANRKKPLEGVKSSENCFSQLQFELGEIQKKIKNVRNVELRQLVKSCIIFAYESAIGLNQYDVTIGILKGSKLFDNEPPEFRLHEIVTAANITNEYKGNSKRIKTISPGNNLSLFAILKQNAISSNNNRQFLIKNQTIANQILVKVKNINSILKSLSPDNSNEAHLINSLKTSIITDAKYLKRIEAEFNAANKKYVESLTLNTQSNFHKLDSNNANALNAASGADTSSTSDDRSISDDSSDKASVDLVASNNSQTPTPITHIAIILQMKSKSLRYKIISNAEVDDKQSNDFTSVTQTNVQDVMNTIINSGNIPEFLTAFNAPDSESNDAVEIRIDIIIDSELKMRIRPNQPASTDSEFVEFKLTGNDRNESITTLIGAIPLDFLQKFHNLYEPTTP